MSDLWQTSDGTNIRISDMKTNHIENTIKHINKNKKQYIAFYNERVVEIYLKEFKKIIRLRKLNALDVESDTENLF